MITATQQSYINEFAYLPEHIIPYVTAVSQAEPFLIQDFLAFVKKDHLIFVGYPLQGPFEEKRMKGSLDEALRRFKPKEVALTAPAIPPSVTGIGKPPLPLDHYYRLDLSNLSVPQKTRNMIGRAMRGLRVQRVGTFREDHRQLVKEFLNSHPVDEAMQSIFSQVPQYVSSVPTAWIFEARNEVEELVAFDIAEFGATHYAMYMFNFISTDCHTPGASDLLLSEILNHARTEQKRYINLGLGINPGITFFKTKWRGVSFFPYRFCLYSPVPRKGFGEIADLLQKL
jgi:hypothetical protein